MVKNPPANAGDRGNVSSVSVYGRSPGREHNSPLQDSCLEHSMDGGAQWAYSPKCHTESDKTEVT